MSHVDDLVVDGVVVVVSEIIKKQKKHVYSKCKHLAMIADSNIAAITRRLQVFFRLHISMTFSYMHSNLESGVPAKYI